MAGFSQTPSRLVFPLKSRITLNTLGELPRDNSLKRTLHSCPRLRTVNPLALNLIREPDTVFCYMVFRRVGRGGWGGGKFLVVALVICLFWRFTSFVFVFRVFSGLFCPSWGRGGGGRGVWSGDVWVVRYPSWIGASWTSPQEENFKCISLRPHVVLGGPDANLSLHGEGHFKFVLLFEGEGGGAGSNTGTNAYRLQTAVFPTGR